MKALRRIEILRTDMGEIPCLCAKIALCCTKKNDKRKRTIYNEEQTAGIRSGR